MLVVIPVCSKDYQLALRNIDHCLTLDGRSDFKAIVSTERGFTEAHRVLEAAGRYFAAVDHCQYEPYHGDPAWPRPQNWSWQETARWIEARYKSPWFWWEQDAVPLKPGWLCALADAHRAGGKLCSGAITQQMGEHYLAGVAIYPWDVSRYFMNALLTQAEAWDKMASRKDGILRRTHDITPFICHVPDRDNVSFASLDEVTRQIPETAVIFHKNKDGTLLDVLQGKALSPVDYQVESNVPRGTKWPSFTEQTPWPCGYFTFPTQLGVTCFYNCSIAEHAGSLWLFTRRHRHRIQDPSGVLSDNASDLAIWQLRKNLTVEPSMLLPAMPNRFPNEQFEDPRVVIDNGTCYISFATWIHKKPWPGRQSFCRLTPDWKRVEVLWETPYGNNARKPDQATGWEKNWTWFKREDGWHCVYTINPHVVFRVNHEGTAVQTYSNKPLMLPWEHGEIRGGTSPVRIGNEYFCFFHSATVWQKPKRRYFMGAYTFSAEPPFELLRFTPEPLLAGSDADFRVLGSPLVIFPNGALRQGDDWLVVFGVNDENCGWIKIPHADLEERLVYAGRKKNLVSRMFEAVAPA